jgi:undecaprenol kinase
MIITFRQGNDAVRNDMQPFEPMPLAEDHSEEPPPRRRRPWGAKFHAALRGMKLGIRGHSSFFVHFFFAALVVAAAVVLRCSIEQWCLLLLCIGGVLTAELFNSAIETLFRGLDDATKERVWPSLDIAAGAVLLASVVAAIVGAVVFIQRFAEILWPE